eukprot:COSAG06_NODE_10382_length_1690_cov_9.626048_2_plen_83_part_00
MMMAASSGVAVRRLAAARTARRVAAGICTKGSGFVPAAQHLHLQSFTMNMQWIYVYISARDAACAPRWQNWRSKNLALGARF